MAVESDTGPPTVEFGCGLLVIADGKAQPLKGGDLKLLDGPHDLSAPLEPGMTVAEIFCSRNSVVPLVADTRAVTQFQAPLYLGHDGLIVVLFRTDGLWRLRPVAGPRWTRAQRAAFRAALVELNRPPL